MTPAQRTQSLGRPLAVLFFGALAGSILAPRVRVSGVSVGLDDAMTVIGGIALLPLLLERNNGRFFARTSILWFSIIASGILAGLYSSYQILNYYAFPTEMWQYVKRMVFFLCGFALVRRRDLSGTVACALLGISLLLASLTGPLQMFGGTFGAQVSEIFARTDSQLLALMQRGLLSQRSFGVAGHSVAWGGFSAFCLVFALSFMLSSGTKPKPLAFGWQLPLLLLASFNVIFSGSRTALLSAGIGVFVCGCLATIRMGSKVSFWLRATIVTTSAIIALSPAIALRSENIQMRLRTGLYELQIGTARIEQAHATLGLLDYPIDWIIGVGNAAQRQVVSFGTEVEPVYLLVNYGIFGLLLRYLLLALIGHASWRCFLYSNTSIGLAALASLAVYVTFSFGYFFFQEIIVGTPPWLLFGIACALGTEGRRPEDSQPDETIAKAEHAPIKRDRAVYGTPPPGRWLIG